MLEPTLVLPPRGDGREVGFRALGDGREVGLRTLGDGREVGLRALGEVRFEERRTDEVGRRSGVDGRAAEPRTWELGAISRREVELELLRGLALRSPPLLGLGCERAPVLRVLPVDLGRDLGFDDGDFADEPDLVEPFDAEGRSRV